MAKRTCPDCQHQFETALPEGTRCGMRKCPSGQSGSGKPQRTTASGKAIDDRRAAKGAKRQTGGYVEQRSTGFGALDAVFGFGRKKRR
jgi:hypothetical protein